MKPKTISQTRVLVSLLMLLMIVLCMPFQTVASSISLSGCPDSCGGVEIPYPFGIGPNCSKPGFELSCKEFNSIGLYASRRLNGTHAPFLLNDTIVLSIYNGRLEVYKNTTFSSCPKSNTPNGWDLSGTPYRISVRNTWTFIGCDIIANVIFGNETNMWQDGCSTTGCYSWGRNIDYEKCQTWNGCCQTSVPKGIKYYYFTLQQKNLNRCGYANLLADAEFNDYAEITSEDDLSKQQSIVVLDWITGNESCMTVKTNKKCLIDGAPDKPYGCISDNSVCVNSRYGPGHYCVCSNSYEGNPYLLGGCVQGIS